MTKWRKFVVTAALAAVGVTVAVVAFRAYTKAKRRKPRVDGILVGVLTPRHIRRMTAVKEPKVAELAVYTHQGGKREVVEVRAAYDEGAGGGFAIFIPSLGRERDILSGRLDRTTRSLTTEVK
jgi:hypothetical protein